MRGTGNAVHFDAGGSASANRNGNVVRRALARGGDEVFAAGKAVPGRHAFLVVPDPIVRPIARIEVPFYPRHATVVATNQVDGKGAIPR